jgi:hypothetical protein
VSCQDLRGSADSADMTCLTWAYSTDVDMARSRGDQLRRSLSRFDPR